jgi:hypothetical protein
VQPKATAPHLRWRAQDGLTLIVERYCVDISAVALRLMRADLLAEADVDAIIHTTTAISPTNAAAAIAAKHRSTESKSSVSPKP